MTLPHVSEKAFAVLDAIIWVSRLISQDEFHVAVKSWMEQQRETGVQFVSPPIARRSRGSHLPANRRPGAWQADDHPIGKLTRIEAG